MSKDDSKLSPSYYRGPKGVQCLEVIEFLGLSYGHGNAMKYVWRSGNRQRRLSLRIQDLKKAQIYIREEIKLLEAKGKKK